MLELLIATTNRGKLREIRPLLDGLPIDLVTLDAWPELAARRKPVVPSRRTPDRRRATTRRQQDS